MYVSLTSLNGFRRQRVPVGLRRSSGPALACVGEFLLGGCDEPPRIREGDLDKDVDISESGLSPTCEDL